jgi:hypothetical protein
MADRGTMGYVSASATQQIYTYASEPLPTIVQFTSTGANSFTVPAGVTYIIANMIGGGGGTAAGASAGTAGGASSVAFAAGTITAAGGATMSTTATGTNGSPATNSTGNRWGAGAITNRYTTPFLVAMRGADGAYIRAGGAVTAGATLTVTVGAGGTAGTNGAAGKQGTVWLEYYAANKRRCDIFQTSGTFNPPSGVTTVNAFIRGAGGGVGFFDGGGGTGGSSSVAFTAGTQTSLGGIGWVSPRGGFPTYNVSRISAANSGDGMIQAYSNNDNGFFGAGENGQERTVQGAVAFGTGVTVTIGTGGLSDQGNAAGSGCVWIEYDLP